MNEQAKQKNNIFVAVREWFGCSVLSLPECVRFTNVSLLEVNHGKNLAVT